MSEQPLIEAATVYSGTAAMFGVFAVVFVLLTLRASGETRAFLLLSLLPTAAMAVAYVLMAQGVATVEVTADGRQQSLMRFVGYTGVLGALVFVFKRLAALSGRLFAVLFAVFVFTPWAALGSWLTSGTAESVMTLLVVVGYLAGTSLLFGPAGRQTATVSRDRRLLFAKLRNLFVICWAALIIQSAMSEQALGITDFFVGQIAASYTDIVLAVGIFGLVYAGTAAFEHRETGDASAERTDDGEVVTAASEN